MLKNPSVGFRLVYGLVVLGVVLPSGMAASGWVTMASGPGPFSAVPLVGPLFMLALGLFRLYQVARYPTTLSSPPVSGIAVLVRVLGQIGMFVGVLATLLGWVAPFLMRRFMHSHTESGAEYFVVGLYISALSGVGLVGLLLFEFNRLLAFERLAYERYMAKHEPPKPSRPSKPNTPADLKSIVARMH